MLWVIVLVALAPPAIARAAAAVGLPRVDIASSPGSWLEDDRPSREAMAAVGLGSLAVGVALGAAIGRRRR